MPDPDRDAHGIARDALKLVSCLMLFGHVARALSAAKPRPEWTTLADEAQAILAATTAQGLPSCRFTEEHCRAGSR